MKLVELVNINMVTLAFDSFPLLFEIRRRYAKLEVNQDDFRRQHREISTPFEAETTNQIKGFGGLVPHTRNSRMNPPVHLPILCPIVFGESRVNLSLYYRTV